VQAPRDQPGQRPMGEVDQRTGRLQQPVAARPDFRPIGRWFRGR
jgi:hypothetical protein